MITINSMDWMDRLIATAVRQGFAVRQTNSGGWHFRRGTITTMVFRRTPINSAEWAEMICALRGAGLVFPIDLDTEDGLDE